MGKRYAPDLLPDPVRFFEAEGLQLVGRGVWRKTACPFHGGSDSLNVNVDTGRWHCWACLVNGGDLIDFVKQRYGMAFMQAAEFLDAVRDDGRPTRPRQEDTLSDRAKLKLVESETWFIVVTLLAHKDAIRNPATCERLIEASRAIQAVMAEVSA